MVAIKRFTIFAKIRKIERYFVLIFALISKTYPGIHTRMSTCIHGLKGFKAIYVYIKR